MNKVVTKESSLIGTLSILGSIFHLLRNIITILLHCFMNASSSVNGVRIGFFANIFRILLLVF